MNGLWIGRSDRDGKPGLAAYFGLLEIGAPRDRETVVVSGAAGAAGAVGMLVGQIAKISWLRDELGLDAVFNYRAAVDLEVALEEL